MQLTQAVLIPTEDLALSTGGQNGAKMVGRRAMDSLSQAVKSALYLREAEQAVCLATPSLGGIPRIHFTYY